MSRVGKFLLFIIVSIVGTVGLIRISFVVEDRWGHEAFIKWEGLAGFTLVLFWLFVGRSEKYLKQKRFWLVVAILLAGHLVAFSIVLSRFEEWKLVWFIVMAIEYPLFHRLRDRFVGPSPEKQDPN
jgi:hypothetical protein